MILLASPPKKPAQLRQHFDPPFLWVMAASGSLLINVAGVMAFSHLLPQPVPPDADPITFEVYDSSTGVASAQRPTANSPSAPAATPLQQLADSKTRSTDAALTPSGRFKTTTGQGVPEDGRSISQQSPTKAQQSTLAHSVKPSTSKLTKTSPDKTSPDKTSQGGTSQQESSQPRATQKESADPDRPADSISTTVAVNATGEPASFLASLVSPTLPKDIPNQPEYPPTIQGEPHKTFVSDLSSCALEGNTFQLATPNVTLRVPVDQAGAIDEQKPILVKEPSGNTSYDELAKCALKTWRFAPGYNVDANGNKVNKPSVLEIQVILTKA